MPAGFGILFPLWDFAADEGRLLERVAGEVGLDHLTVPVVTGAHTQFRLGHETPHFHTEGGWHYRTSTKAYAGVALRPYKAKWQAGGDMLAQIRARGRELKIKLLVRLNVRAVRALVDQERHLCQRNAWGQEVPFAGACACNPDLRELVRATCEDLRRYEPDGFELVDWAPDSAEDRNSARPLNWHPGVRRLLDTCFCASCRQVAERGDVDAESAARVVRVTVEKLVAASAGAGEPLPEDPILAAYQAVRAADCAQWLHRLADQEGELRRLLVRNYGENGLQNCAPWLQLTRIPPGAYGPADGAGWAERLRAVASATAVALPVWRPTFEAPAELVRLLPELVRAGITLLDFEGLTDAPPETVDWLRQAVRYARREA